MNLKSKIISLAEELKRASQGLGELPSRQKDKVLNETAHRLKKGTKKIIRANQKDLQTAKKMKLSNALLDRLMLNQKRIEQMADAVSQVAQLKDPVGKILAQWKRPNGLRISKVSVPLGVILIIYESRPNVTSECASLCFKSGNAVLLRGGREAFHSNQAIVDIYQSTLKHNGISPSTVSLVPVLEREAIDELLKLDHLINLVIPRGGEDLIRRVVEKARMPVIKHYKGICHVYIDRDADLKMALNIAFNAKLQRTGVCNAMETLLVHQDIAKKFLPVYGDLLKKADCEIRGDEKTRQIVKGIKAATEADWGTEYLDRILSIRVVKNLQQAIDHIQKYGSAHTDSIVTKNSAAAKIFVSKVDSSSVMVNASTRFSDGNEYGFGAEIGISTDKVHARGPMGLEGLVSYKYVVRGSGQIRT